MQKGYGAIRPSLENVEGECGGIFPTREKAEDYIAANPDKGYQLCIVNFEVITATYNPFLLELDAIGLTIMVV